MSQQYWETQLQALLQYQSANLIADNSQAFPWAGTAMLYKLSNQNKQNAMLLLGAALQWLEKEAKADFYGEIQFGDSLIPIFSHAETTDFKQFAKAQLQIFRSHATQLPFDISGLRQRLYKNKTPLFASCENLQQASGAAFRFVLGEADSSDIYCIFPSKAKDFVSILLMEILQLLESIPTGNAFQLSEDFQQHFIRIFSSQKDETGLELEKVWMELFTQALHWEQSYFENGGDSIAAIRLLAKLKKMGYQSDLATLLSAKTILQWWGTLAQKENKNEISPIESPRSYPLSWMQQLVWNHARLNMAQQSYHEQFLFELDNSPNQEEIAVAFAAIWQAYPQLRVQIGYDNKGQLIQTITDSKPDFRFLPNQATIEALLESDKKEGFEQRLMRCTLFSCAGKSYLLWSHHHVLLDGWSVGQLIAQFVENLQNKAALPQQPNYQYQLLLQEQAIGKREETYWQGFFKRFEPLVLPKSAAAQSHFESLSLQIDKTVLSNFELAAATQKTSLQNWLLSAFGLLLYGLNGKPEQFFHSISSGRAILPESAEKAIGLFIRNISIGISVAADASLQSYFATTQAQFLEALSQEFSDPETQKPYLSEMPELLFVFENYPYQDIKSEKISGRLVYNFEQTAYPLTFLLMPSREGLKLQLIYDAGKFSEAFSNALLQQFLRYCQALLQAPSATRLSDLQQYFDKEQARITTAPELWYQQTDKNLQASQEFVFGKAGEQVSYPEVYRNARKMLAHLQDLGIEKGARIALYAERDAHLPALVYALLRSGYCYLPLHSAWPLQRMATVLELADCQQLIYTGDTAPPLAARFIHPQDWENSPEAELPELSLDSEAYLLFTSGSTGQPKGVSLSQRNLSAFLADAAQLIGNRNFDYLFSLTNIGFDLSIFENLYGFYINKPTVVIDGIADLETKLDCYRGGLLNTVPSVLSRLTDKEIQSLHIVHTAGEPFTEGTFRHLRQANPTLIIRNWYGPTETTTYSSFKELGLTYSPTIGKALPRETLEIWDFLNIPQAAALPGQIVIGGEGVALGYINGEKDKFKIINGLNYYLTGDRAYSQDSEIFLLGRNDRQLKRFGQRFEPAEIEKAVFDYFPYTKRVYYAKNEAEYFVLFIELDAIDKKVLSDNLSARFPAYMLPDRIWLCPEFPENNNGKLDTIALWQLLPQNEQQEDVTSETPLLTRLKAAFPPFAALRGNLGFIAQGGDSILGLRLIGKLKSWGYEAELGALFNAPRLDSWLSALAGSRQSASKETNLLALSPIQNWFWKEYSGNKNHFNQSILLEIALPLSPAALAELTGKALSAFPLLGLVYEEQNGWQSAKHQPQVAHYELEEEAEITAICAKLQSSFNLQTGPIWAAALFTVKGKTYLFIAIHHFYCDGYTWRLVLDALQALLRGEMPDMQGPEVFSFLEEAQIALNLEKAEAYWKRKIQHPFAALAPANYAESNYEEWTWSASDSELFLRDFPARWGTRLNENFLILFLSAWRELYNIPVTAFFETHGRSYEAVPGLSEAAGWFTQFYPVMTEDINEDSDLTALVKTAFAALPDEGLSYMALQNWQRPPFPVLLNFLGSFDEHWGAMAKPSELEQGQQADAQNPLLGYIEWNALVLNGQIKWMLRTHPQISAKALHEAIEQARDRLNEQKPSISADLSALDADDLDAIAGLLGELE